MSTGKLFHRTLSAASVHAQKYLLSPKMYSNLTRPSLGTLPKKPKGKKTPDASETSKLLAAKISQLELDKAGEKDQEAEIGGYMNISSSEPVQFEEIGGTIYND